MSTLSILISRYQKPIIGPGELIFAGIFIVGFIIAISWSYLKEKKINRTYYRNSGIFALAVGGVLLLTILLKFLLRQSG